MSRARKRYRGLHRSDDDANRTRSCLPTAQRWLDQIDPRRCSQAHFPAVNRELPQQALPRAGGPKFPAGDVQLAVGLTKHREAWAKVNQGTEGRVNMETRTQQFIRAAVGMHFSGFQNFQEQEKFIQKVFRFADKRNLDVDALVAQAAGIPGEATTPEDGGEGNHRSVLGKLDQQNARSKPSRHRPRGVCAKVGGFATRRSQRRWPVSTPTGFKVNRRSPSRRLWRLRSTQSPRSCEN